MTKSDHFETQIDIFERFWPLSKFHLPACSTLHMKQIYIKNNHTNTYLVDLVSQEQYGFRARCRACQKSVFVTNQFLRQVIQYNTIEF